MVRHAVTQPRSRVEATPARACSASPYRSAASAVRGRHQQAIGPLLGCPDYAVPDDHLARTVLEQVARIDTSALEARYSSLGRRGYHPRSVLGVWVYASVVGIHHASKVAERMKTDQAFLLLSGGQTFSATTLRAFRRENGEFFANAVQQTIGLAVDAKLLDPEQLAVDGMRLQAAASTKSVRTVTRSKSRLDELDGVDRESLTDEERAEHDAKVAKHAEAVRRCESEGRTSHSVTDPHAALMKFPNGASLPGHRIGGTACGASLRFIVSVLITSKANDFGQLEACVRDAHRALLDAGMPVREGAPRMQVAADPGYLSEADLTFAADNADWVDVLIHEPPPPKRTVEPGGTRQLSRDEFTINPDGTAICPAGRQMLGPFKGGKGLRQWKGKDCANCPLKAQCTRGKQRTLTQNVEGDRVRDAMRARMAEPGAKERYNKRIATVEPVFSYIQDTMGFRRLSSRKTETVHAEIMLKVLSYNLMRLAKGRRCVCALVSVEAGVAQVAIIAAWLPWASTTREGPRVSDLAEGDVRATNRGSHSARIATLAGHCVRPLFSLTL